MTDLATRQKGLDLHTLSGVPVARLVHTFYNILFKNVTLDIAIKSFRRLCELSSNRELFFLMHEDIPNGGGVVALMLEMAVNPTWHDFRFKYCRTGDLAREFIAVILERCWEMGVHEVLRFWLTPNSALLVRIGELAVEKDTHTMRTSTFGRLK